MGVDAGKYIVEPTAPGYGFSPASTKVSALTDVANLTFTASAGFTISGRVTNLLGFAESGISLILTNNSNWLHCYRYNQDLTAHILLTDSRPAHIL